ELTWNERKFVNDVLAQNVKDVLAQNVNDVMLDRPAAPTPPTSSLYGTGLYFANKINFVPKIL
ncbi:hypothetical protein, partial [uncultured Acidaminococcus sp.]|uniref:hypothetical protein n=1 Tax=uncultured Acidaminococcus sp. TaxID=352152 RepID=UPI00258AF248